MKITPIFPIVILSLAPIAPVAAQLAPDNSLGAESSVVTPVNQTRDRIDGGAVRGSNLFHSFGSFNVDAGRSVYFANTPAIENILTRVTGGNPSKIFGTLGVEGNANLFLINPAGILFGRDARLDISGSFFATTGDGIRLGKNGVFSTTDLDPSKLLHVRPEALFTNALANHMARLNNQGNLAVGTGSALVLHGGQVTNSGSLTAPSGTVMVLGERISLLDDASIDVSSSTGGGRVFIGSFLGGRGNIPTAGRTYIGPDVTISADAAIRGDGGNVMVTADEGTGFYGNIRARGGRNGGDGGVVEVSAGESLIFRGDVDTTAALGKAGTLLLDTRNIAIANGSDGGSDVTIYESELEGLSGENNLVLQATNDITVADLADDSLNFASGRGEIKLIADADGDGVGDFFMEDRGDTINTNGRDIAITGASLTLGNIDTSLLAAAPDGVGELLSTAAVVSTEPGEQLVSISGNLFSAEDVDLYQIYLTGEGTFSATTIDGSNVDTELFLFDAEGLGLYGNDDNRAACKCPQSTLPGFDRLTPTTPGIYYLGISVYGVKPVSESGEIFAALTNSNLLEPTGSGSALPLVGWQNVRGDDLGDYTITLTGVEGRSATFAEVIDNTVLSNSGAITLAATNGNIIALDLNGASFSGAGGEIQLDAAADIVLNGRVDASGVVGGGGDITLNSGGKINLNRSFLTSSTNGRGDAGKVTITARDTVRFNGGGASTQVNSNGLGDAGGIEITTGSLAVMDGALVSTSTDGIGDAGTIKIAATERVLLRGGTSQGRGSIVFSLVEESGEGKAGGIQITTTSLELMDGARLDASTFGVGDAGRISIAATESVILRGEDSLGFPSRIFSRVTESGEGKAGGIEITTGQLLLPEGSLLQASTQGRGKAGRITVNAEVVDIAGSQGSRGLPSGLFTSTNSESDAGDITVNSNVFQIAAGGVLSGRSRGDGRGGTIAVNTHQFTASSGGQLVTTTFGNGVAGNIEVNASGEVSLSGRDPTYLERIANFGELEDPNVVNDINETGAETGLYAGSTESSTQAGGTIALRARSLRVGDGARITANSDGTGSGGNIFINADRLQLEDGSNINTDTASGLGGGNITLTGLDLRVRDNSKIETNAEGRGNGGDITINTDTLAVLEGSSITANAVEGRGGNIAITTSGLFSSPDSDITASSQFGVSGIVTVNNPDSNPTAGLVSLPKNPIDPNQQIVTGCRATLANGSFIVTGRGGLAEDPTSIIRGTTLWRDLANYSEETPPSPGRSGREGKVVTERIRSEERPIVQATGWVRHPDGTVELVALIGNASIVGWAPPTILRDRRCGRVKGGQQPTF